MYYNYDGTPNFNSLNRATSNANHRNVDRFNESTKSNYSYYDPWSLNNRTYKENNGQYSNHYNYYKK